MQRGLFLGIGISERFIAQKLWNALTILIMVLMICSLTAKHSGHTGFMRRVPIYFISAGLRSVNPVLAETPKGSMRSRMEIQSEQNCRTERVYPAVEIIGIPGKNLIWRRKVCRRTLNMFPFPERCVLRVRPAYGAIRRWRYAITNSRRQPAGGNLSFLEEKIEIVG